MDCSLPCSSICGILQARVLEWVAVSFSTIGEVKRQWTNTNENNNDIRFFTWTDLQESEIWYQTLLMRLPMWKHILIHCGQSIYWHRPNVGYVETFIMVPRVFMIMLQPFILVQKTRQAWWWCSVTHSWLTVGNPMDCRPPGSSVHGNLQARVLGWVPIPFSRGLVYLTCIMSLHSL